MTGSTAFPGGPGPADPQAGGGPAVVGPAGGPAIDHRDEYAACADTAARLRAAGFEGAVAIVQTGSGIPAPDLADRRTVLWRDLPGMPRATAPGHRGAFHFGTCRGVPVLVLEGRLHGYEGHPLAHVVRPVRAAALLGIPRAILTNASGGVRADLRAGDLLRVTDHVNLLGADPTTGIHDPRFGDRFTILAGRTYDARLGDLADRSAAARGIPLAKGVYGAVHGPAFETPAQVRMLRAVGVDLCGMSTVPEVTALAQLGVRTLVLALVANPAGVVAEGQSAETEVLAEGQRSGARLTTLVEDVLGRIAGGEDAR